DIHIVGLDRAKGIGAARRRGRERAAALRLEKAGLNFGWPARAAARGVLGKQHERLVRAHQIKDRVASTTARERDTPVGSDGEGNPAAALRGDEATIVLLSQKSQSSAGSCNDSRRNAADCGSVGIAKGCSVK